MPQWRIAAGLSIYELEWNTRILRVHTGSTRPSVQTRERDRSAEQKKKLHRNIYYILRQANEGNNDDNYECRERERKSKEK